MNLDHFILSLYIYFLGQQFSIRSLVNLQILNFFILAQGARRDFIACVLLPSFAAYSTMDDRLPHNAAASTTATIADHSCAKR